MLGVGVAAAFYVWLLTRSAGGGVPFVLGLGSVVPLTAAVAVLHDGTARAPFGGAWRLAAACLGLLTLAASALFLALAVGVALLGVAREMASLTNIAIAAIVLFVAVQSFGLIAPLFSGAALIVAVGAILVVCGLLAARGRRRLLRGGALVSAGTTKRRRMRRATTLALALTVQLALIGAVAAPRLAPRLTGTEYRIATVALDPIDPFRGAYVESARSRCPGVHAPRGHRLRPACAQARRDLPWLGDTTRTADRRALHALPREW